MYLPCALGVFVRNVTAIVALIDQQKHAQEDKRKRYSKHTQSCVERVQPQCADGGEKIIFKHDVNLIDCFIQKNTYLCRKIIKMETLIIKSKSKSNTQLLSELARKLGAHVEVNNEKKDDRKQTYLAIESAWAKDWLTPEEDEAWKDL